MSHNCFVVSACSKYLPELTALLNSLDLIGNQDDVHLSGYKLPGFFLDQLGLLNYTVIHHPISEPEARQYGGEGEILCRRRYWDAAMWGQEYAATCILDADMFFVRPVLQFFEIAASAKLIVGAGLEQKRVYGNEPNQRVQMGPEMQYLLPPFWNNRDICCAPIFVDMKLYGNTFRSSWTMFSMGGFKAPDMEAINLMFHKDGLAARILQVSNTQFVGTNEKLLKPYIRVVRQEQDPEVGSRLWTETGDAIYIVHGQFYKAKWRRQQIRNRHGCIEGYIGGSEKCENMAFGAMELLHRTFKTMLDLKIQIPKDTYCNDGHPERIDDEHLVGV